MRLLSWFYAKTKQCIQIEQWTSCDFQFLVQFFSLNTYQEKYRRGKVTKYSSFENFIQRIILQQSFDELPSYVISRKINFREINFKINKLSAFQLHFISVLSSNFDRVSNKNDIFFI